MTEEAIQQRRIQCTQNWQTTISASPTHQSKVKQGKAKQSKTSNPYAAIHMDGWMDGWAKEQEPWCESSNQSYSTMRARAQRVKKNYVK